MGSAAAGLALVGGRAGEAAEQLLRMTEAPPNYATPLAYFDRLVTPTDAFFVRCHFGVPAPDPGHRLRVTGLVKKPLELSAGDLAKLPQVTTMAVLQCAGNGRARHQPRVPGVQWDLGAMGQAAFTGPRLADVLARAGVTATSGHVRLAGLDLPPKPLVPGFIRGIPLERALHPDTIVVLRMNGEPLTQAHGAPMRLAIPGFAGNHWVKWLHEVHVQAEPVPGFFMDKAYRYPKRPVEPGAAVPPEETDPVTTFPIRSVIARPADGSTAGIGRHEIAGVAFSGTTSIAKVEVSVDGGVTWQVARLEGEPGTGRWQVFRHELHARTPGTYEVVARAVGTDGVAQPETAAWNPSGYFWNGYHRVSFKVEA